MFLPSFRHLIEIEALKNQNNQNIMQISGEKKRISDLSGLRTKTTLYIENLKNEEKNLNLFLILEQLNIHETRFKKLNEQLLLAANEKEQLAFENQIRLVKIEIEQAENLYFQNLEISESMQLEIKDKKEFLEGSFVTLEEIKKEVEINISAEQKIINNRNLRIEALTDLLLPGLKSLYLELEFKFKPKKSISFLIDKKCSECHLQADSQLKNSLEEGRSIETCPACARILIPETAKIY